MKYNLKKFPESINNILIEWFTNVLGEIFEEKNIEKAIDLSNNTIDAFLKEVNYLNKLVHQFELSEKKFSHLNLFNENHALDEISACLGLLKELKGVSMNV